MRSSLAIYLTLLVQSRHQLYATHTSIVRLSIHIETRVRY